MRVTVPHSQILSREIFQISCHSLTVIVFRVHVFFFLFLRDVIQLKKKRTERAPKTEKKNSNNNYTTHVRYVHLRISIKTKFNLCASAANC